MNCPHCSSENLAIHGRNPPRYICGDCGRTTRKPIQGYQFPVQSVQSSIVAIVWAQNATPVFKPFMRSLLTYCEERSAQLLVVPGRYKNPTSSWTPQQEDHEWWADEVTPYLCDSELAINSNLTLMGNVKVQPTAVDPLSGLKTMGGPSSTIYGHPQIAFDTVATPQSKLAKIVCTTGAITVPNYTDSKAGVKGEFNHEYGATVVEIEGGKFHMRQIIADGSGKFYDLDKCYHGNKVTSGHRAEAFVAGDIHAKFIDPMVKSAWWTGENSLCSLIKPKVQVLHDVFDGYFGSHHHERDPFLQYRKHINGDNLGEAEIQTTVDVLNEISVCDKNYVVKSNHDEHFDKWLKSLDWRNDYANARLYIKTAAAWIDAIDAGKPFDPIAFWIAPNVPRVTFLQRNDKLMVKGHALSYHGDAGPNGSRGSAKSFNHIGTRSVIGHSHSPKREKGCLQVGLSAIYGLEYATGSPSSWMQTAAIIYPNGKATLITAIDGKYTL